jgi:LuxR family transcriptional regulator, maltose regulon positive regulatory protein
MAGVVTRVRRESEDTVASRRLPRFVAAKVACPGMPPTHVSRVGLRSALTSGASGLALVSAPAGTGKTTLLAEWVQRDLDGRAAWLSIDRRDNDPVRFWMYVLAAIQTLEPDLGIGTLDLLSGRAGCDSVDVSEALVAELGSLDPPHVLTLVLDDLHNLSERSIYEGLDSLIERRPPGLRIVLSTRADPLLRLGRFRASGSLLELRQADLRFSQLEAQELFRTPAPGLAPRDLDLLVDRTEGWIIALQMAAVALRANRDLGRHLDQIAALDSTLADYLVAEVMEGLPEEVREFLLLSSVLEELLPDACDAVTRRDDSRRILTYLRQHNLFLVAPDAAHSSPRYHHLFAELLRVELRTVDPEAERAANLRAAGWFRSTGDSASAMDHLFAAGAYDEALGVLMDNAVGYYDAGLARSMIEWIERFPPGFFDAEPKRTLDLAAMLCANGRYAEATDWLQRLEGTAAALVDADPVLRARLPAIRALCAHMDGQPSESIEWIERALATYHEDADDGYHSRMPLALVRSWGWLGDTPAARAAWSRTYPVPSPPDDLARPLTAAAMSQIYLIEGHLQEADALAEISLGELDDTQAPFAIEARLTRAGVAWDRDQLERAEREFDLALREAEQHHRVPFVVMAALGLARIWHATGRRAEAWEVLAVARRARFPRALSGTFADRVDLAVAKLSLLEGRLSESREVLDRLPWRVESALVRVRLSLEQGEPTAAAKLLRRLERAPLTPRERLDCQLLDVRLGSSSAPRSLRDAVSFAEREGFVRPFVDQGVDPPLGHGPRLPQDGVGDGAPVERAELDVAMIAAAPAPTELLTDSELGIVKYLPEWLSNKEIADQLYVSVNTVKTHLKSIYRKLDVTSRTDAIARAKDLGLL